MIDAKVNREALDFLQLKEDGIEKRIYKSACKYDTNDSWFSLLANWLNIPIRREKYISGAFVVYKDEKGLLHYSQKDYIDNQNNEFFFCLQRVMSIANKTLPKRDNVSEQEKLNMMLANALSQASYGNYQLSRKNIVEAEAYYTKIITAYRRRNLSIYGGLFVIIAIVSCLFVLQQTDKILEGANNCIALGLTASVLGVFVSMCQKAEFWTIEDETQALCWKFICEVFVRILVGVISAAILFAAVYSGWISSKLFDTENALTYVLIGFVAGTMERKITTVVDKIASLMGIFNEHSSKTQKEVVNNTSTQE